MPIYLYQHPKTKETKEVIQRMTEPHVFVDENGTAWNRIFCVPQAQIVTKIDPFSRRSFVEGVGEKKGNFGDLFDQSKEASEARKKRLGYDPVEKKSLEDWGKKRGMKHPKLKAMES